MYQLLGAALVIGVGVWFVWAPRRYQHWLLKMAHSAESDGQFETAVYYYGRALQNLYSDPEALRGKIRALWKQHGPFTFSGEREKISRRTDIDRDGDLKQLEDAVRIINEVASGKSEKHSWEA